MFTIYDKHMFLLECLRNLLLAGLKLHLSVVKGNSFPLRLENAL